MTVLQSRINTRDAAFAANREHMQAQVDDLHTVVMTDGRVVRAHDRELLGRKWHGRPLVKPRRRQ